MTQPEFERPEKRARFDGNGDAGPPIDETAPAHLDDLCNALDRVRQSTCNERIHTEDAITSVGIQETAKMRAPHPHDVLFRHGEAFNFHQGNVQFRY
jgi:hypothetical protein